MARRPKLEKTDQCDSYENILDPLGEFNQKKEKDPNHEPAFDDPHKQKQEKKN